MWSWRIQRSTAPSQGRRDAHYDGGHAARAKTPKQLAAALRRHNQGQQQVFDLSCALCTRELRAARAAGPDAPKLPARLVHSPGCLAQQG